jgi:hypothetical protein
VLGFREFRRQAIGSTDSPCLIVLFFNARGASF